MALGTANSTCLPSGAVMDKCCPGVLVSGICTKNVLEADGAALDGGVDKLDRQVEKLDRLIDVLVGAGGSRHA